MSVYRQQSTAMNDIDCLEDTLKESKSQSGKMFTPERHEPKAQLEGYEGKLRDQKAELILRRKEVGGSSNDMGFERGEDGNFIAHISAYDSRFYGGQWLNDLKANYAVKKALKIARQQGYTHLKTTNAKGKTIVQFAARA
jgi:hypothetical protein